jgi:carbon starvation protein
VPTNRYVLWGHHFTSVAGAAPIVGPAIAVYWGWVPAVLWVVLGTIFFAGVHDFGALWASNRHKGRSMGALSETVIGSRSRALYMIVVFLVLLMVNSVFGVVIARARSWHAQRGVPGLGRHRRGADHRSAGAPALQPDRAGARRGGGAVLEHLCRQRNAHRAARRSCRPGPQANWIIILFVYAAIASMLPVWVLLQPRDFINGMQLIVGLHAALRLGVPVLPDISAPAINNQLSDTAPSIIPLLFVTIACGAVSGFHGIVASGHHARSSSTKKPTPASSATWAPSAKAPWR